MSTAFADISYPLVNGIYNALATMSVPVEKSVPKPAPAAYILISGVIQTEDGTKDDFVYRGTVQVRVVMDGLQRADKKAAQTLLSEMRGLLKPSKAAVFSVTPNTLIAFSHESMTELIEQTETGVKVSLIDIYNFLIE